MIRRGSALASPAVHLEGRLELTAGQVSDAGRRETNEDCMGLRVPDEPGRTLKGVAAVIADGVSSAAAGREASELCVQSFLADYYSTPETYSVKRSAAVVLTALNRWLYSRSSGIDEAHRGHVSTFSAIVIKSQTAHVLHVGDSRVYRLREGHLEQLTRDHTTHISETERYLSRAMGMDASLDVDYRPVQVRSGDVFLLTTDGVHDWVADDQLQTIVEQGLLANAPFESICRTVIERADAADSDDNLTCQLLRIDDVAPPEADEVHRDLARLPLPPFLEPGMVIDGYRVEREIHASSRSQLYLVTDIETGRRLAMKTPSVNFEDDPAYLERFVMEPWIGGRIDHPAVVEVVDMERPKTFLYYVMDFVDGQTLNEWRAARGHVEIREVTDIIAQTADGLQAFLRREMLHQDIKPANIMVDRDGRVRIVDFGSCWVAGIREIATPIERDIALGTAQYAAPETRLGETAGAPSEIFSLSAVTYELLTGQPPFGDAIESVCSVKDFDALKYRPSYELDPMIPPWLDRAMRKGLAARPEDRYSVFSELVYDLQHPNPDLGGRWHTPRDDDSDAWRWRLIAAALLVLWVATIAFFLSGD